jgi:hypothetical protein
MQRTLTAVRKSLSHDRSSTSKTESRTPQLVRDLRFRWQLTDLTSYVFRSDFLVGPGLVGNFCALLRPYDTCDLSCDKCTLCVWRLRT